MKNDDGTPLWVEAPKRQIQKLAIGDERSDVGCRRFVDRGQLDLDGSTAAMTQRIDAGANDEATEPSLEAIRIAERRQVSPGADESILDRVSRELMVPEDQAGRRVQPRDKRAGKLGEGVMIASPRPLDELSLVHGDPR